MANKKTIVWVADDEDMERMLVVSSMLKKDRDKYEVREFSSADELLAEFPKIRYRNNQDKNRPDVIITDDQMGAGKTGMDVLAEAKTLGIPAIMRSGTADPAAAIAAGATGGFIKKPDYSNIDVKVDAAIANSPYKGRTP